MRAAGSASPHFACGRHSISKFGGIEASPDDGWRRRLRSLDSRRRRCHHAGDRRMLIGLADAATWRRDDLAIVTLASARSVRRGRGGAGKRRIGISASIGSQTDFNLTERVLAAILSTARRRGRRLAVRPDFGAARRASSWRNGLICVVFVSLDAPGRRSGCAVRPITLCCSIDRLRLAAGRAWIGDPRGRGRCGCDGNPSGCGCEGLRGGHLHSPSVDCPPAAWPPRPLVTASSGKALLLDDPPVQSSRSSSSRSSLSAGGWGGGVGG